MDFYRFGAVCFLALWSFSLTSSMPVTQEKEGRFLDFEKLFSDPNTQIAALAGLGVVALAANNVLSGNDRIRIRPNLGFNYNPETSALTPSLTANVQVGDGHVAPSFNVGGQFDPNNNGIPVAPVVGTGLNIGDSSGAFNPAVTSNFALQNGQANAQFGGGANIGSLDLGNGGTDFENLLDFSQIGNLLQGR